MSRSCELGLLQANSLQATQEQFVCAEHGNMSLHCAMLRML